MIGERGYERRSASITDAVAQMEVESGNQRRAAVSRFPALCLASDPTRNGNTHEGEIDHV